MSCDFVTLLWVQNSFDNTSWNFSEQEFCFHFQSHSLAPLSFRFHRSFHASLATYVVSLPDIRTTKTTFDIILEPNGTSKTFMLLSPCSACVIVYEISTFRCVCAFLRETKSYKKVFDFCVLWINSHKFSAIESVSVSSARQIHSARNFLTRELGEKFFVFSSAHLGNVQRWARKGTMSMTAATYYISCLNIGKTSSNLTSKICCFRTWSRSRQFSVENCADPIWLTRRYWLKFLACVRHFGWLKMSIEIKFSSEIGKYLKFTRQFTRVAGSAQKIGECFIFQHPLYVLHFDYKTQNLRFWQTWNEFISPFSFVYAYIEASTLPFSRVSADKPSRKKADN